MLASYLQFATNSVWCLRHLRRHSFHQQILVTMPDFNRYIVLHDNPEDGIAGEFTTLVEAKKCSGTVGLIVVPLHEVEAKCAE